MIYGVKVIHTNTVGSDDRRFYEEMILTVNAESFDEAYEKAEKYIQRYMQDDVCEYTNIYNETVKTLRIEAVDCFLALEILHIFWILISYRICDLHAFFP